MVRSFTVSVVKSQGTLVAAPNSPFAVGSFPLAAAVGDFNGDGKPDLAIANNGANNVTVLLGNGSGGFTAATGSPFAAGANPDSIATGDFNGDGIQDVVTTNYNANSLTLLLGNGSGGFAPAAGSPYIVGLNPISVAVGDFNGDGIQDLAVANYSFPGSPYAVGANPVFVAVGDFNKDGIQDLAVANLNSNTVSILLGTGSGTFAAPAGSSPFLAGYGPNSIAIGDFNGDGIPDLAMANYAGVSAILGTGSGTFITDQASPFPAVGSPASIVAADFNGDGIIDLAAVSPGANSVTVLLGDGTGAFVAEQVSPYPVAGGPYALVTGDFNGDGMADLATVNHNTNGTVTVLLGSQTGQTPQNINFNLIAGAAFGTPPFTIAATASSGVSVGFASVTPAVCTVTGAVVTLVNVGACMIQASVQGSATYAPSTVTETCNVNPGKPPLIRR